MVNLIPESLFISDLHLGVHNPGTVEQFLEFCSGRAAMAERLFILGDLFNTYIGDDSSSWPAVPVKRALARLSGNGTQVFFQHGNRDFLLGEQFASETGVSLLGDYAVIDLYGLPTLLTHGDLLCTDDVQYQRARVRVRSEQWKRNALGKPLWVRQFYARWYRFKSGRDKSAKSMEIMDANFDAIADVVVKFGVSQLIHGHTHRPGIHTLRAGDKDLLRVVLPEWAGQEWVLVWNSESYRMEPLTYASA